MEMFRIKCTKCEWSTLPHFSIIDCIKEKELDHHFGKKEKNLDAHNFAFGETCPHCGAKTVEEFRFFSDAEISFLKEQRYCSRAERRDDT